MADYGLTIGGFYIKSYEATRSWGIEPASAGGTGVLNGAGGSPPIGVGDYVAFSFLGVTFYGIVSSFERIRSFEAGDEYQFQIVDNRIRLRWGLVFGQWNMEEEAWRCHSDPVPERPSALDQWYGGEVGFDQGVDFTGGIESLMGSPEPLVRTGSASRGKMFAHIPPGYWASQFRIFSTQARSAAEILTEAVHGSVGGRGVGLSFHAAQSKPVFSVDANSGTSLAAFIQQMADAQGLQITMDGTKTLRFSRRGEGVVVIPSGAHVRRLGEAISSEPTKVRVVGGRRLVQVNEVPLVHDWNRKWEAFLAEPAWLNEVKTLMSQGGPVSMDSAMYAEIAARAREITLSQYIKEKSLSVADPSDLESEFADNGRWGRISRMDMPVWQYLNSIVFRSYRISKDATLYGLPMRSLEIHDALLCAVTTTENNNETRIVYRSDPLEFYPQASGFVMAKGQQLDLKCAEQTDALIRQRSKDLRDVWSEVADFSIDADSHAIRFATPVFLDGDPDEDEAILLYPNRGQAGGTDLTELFDEKGSPYLDIVVPNPDFKIEPAEVKATLVFRLGKFFKDFGSGARWTVYQASALAEHLLHGADGFAATGTAAYEGNPGVPDPPPEGFREILMDDGNTAAQTAAIQSEGLIVRSGIEASGEYVRHGAAGTQLTGGIDRISVRLTTAGLEETVEMAKPRPTRGFVSSREMADRLKNEELYDSQRELEQEIRDYRAMARHLRSGNDEKKPRGANHASMADVFVKPLGTQDTDVRTIPDPDNQYPEGRTGENDEVVAWKAGDLVWLDEHDSPSRTGTLFGGVVVMASPTVGQPGSQEAVKYITIARSGTVPVNVIPGTAPGPIMANPGDWKAGPTGTWPIGMLAHAVAVPGSGEATLALVTLGGGGSTGAKIPPLTLVTSRPSYVPQPTSAIAENHARFYMTWGMVNGILADNWSNCLDVPTEAETRRYIDMKAYLAPEGEYVVVTRCEWVTYTQAQKDANAFVTPKYKDNGDRPDYMYIPIGMIQVAAPVGDAVNGIPSILNESGGSIRILEYVSTIDFSALGGVKYKKALNPTRLSY